MMPKDTMVRLDTASQDYQVISKECYIGIEEVITNLSSLSERFDVLEQELKALANEINTLILRDHILRARLQNLENLNREFLLHFLNIQM
ncbi:hypothetical protein NQ318_018260 [Aromia moschata]|uniref:Uncharacterized protein n=1 Tax=Aromia moschata TaxID=1265417 RepID=A0AAV8ZDH6_9CUCU|nr:hypothetical protein NQ318_018260 [Aromia moschata]